MTVQESTDPSPSPSAMREFDTSSVAAGGGPVLARITVSGATQAVVTENLPTGFTYVERAASRTARCGPTPMTVSASGSSWSTAPTTRSHTR